MADRNVDDGCESEAVGRIVGADAVLGFEIVENLGIASAEQIGDEGVRAGGGVVG